MLNFIADYPNIAAPPRTRHLTPSPTSFARENSYAGGDALPPTSPRLLAGDNLISPFGGAYRTTDAGYITVGYRGTFSFGRDGAQADVKFRKLWRILVNGKV